MNRHLFLTLGCVLASSYSILSFAGETKILTNHLGYEVNGPKHAVILGKRMTASRIAR